MINAEGKQEQQKPAETPKPSAGSGNVYVPPRKKLSIYDNAETYFEIVDTPNEIELGLRHARHIVTNYFASTRAEIQKYVDQWIQFETQIATTVGKYTVKSEPLLPNILYVTLAGFGGSILAKNRGLVSRVGFPLLFVSGSVGYFYPVTSQNVLSVTWKSGVDAGILPETLPGSEAAAGAYKSVSSGIASAYEYISSLFK